MRGYNFSIPGGRENIENGTKVLTMRRDRKDGWLPEVGEEFGLTDGSRWKKAGTPGSIQPILIGGKNPVCTGVWPVEIDEFCDAIRVKTKFFKEIMKYSFPANRIDSFLKSEKTILNEFAIMDGWNIVDEMFEFFKDHYGLPVKLNLIYWGPR